jgi:hypothetical protein
MAVILEFRRSEEDADRAAKPIEGSLGEIIIFPGVRIERQTARKRQSSAPLRKRAQRGRKKSS